MPGDGEDDVGRVGGVDGFGQPVAQGRLVARPVGRGGGRKVFVDGLARPGHGTGRHEAVCASSLRAREVASTEAKAATSVGW